MHETQRVLHQVASSGCSGSNIKSGNLITWRLFFDNFDLICKNVNDFIEVYKYTRIENLNNQI